MIWQEWLRSLGLVPGSCGAEERQGVNDASPASVEPPAATVDPFWADQHRGSPDLNEWPPNNTERQIANRALDGEPSAPSALRALCHGPLRAEAIKHRLRVERAAAAVIARIKEI